MTEEQGVDENKCIRPREGARGQKRRKRTYLLTKNVELFWIWCNN